jgi:hypothetical protein
MHLGSASLICTECAARSISARRSPRATVKARRAGWRVCACVACVSVSSTRTR